METVIIGGLIAIINGLVLFELSNLNGSVKQIIRDYSRLNAEVATVKATVHACPTCRQATEG